MTDTAVRRARWLAPALLTLGSLGCAAAWILLALASDRQCSAMALLAGLDAALLLRLAGMPRGRARMLLALLGTAAAIAVANWGIAAGQIGRVLGLLPWESALKLGANYAWTLVGLVNTPAELAWLAGGLLLAVIAAR
ncbi:MAG: hypothetical protein ABIR05_03825 [Luteimonas sp.]